MFAHKEISHRVRGPTRSKNAQQLLVWVYRERCVHILCAFWTYYTQCLCWFCTAKASLRPPLHHAMCSLVKRHARVMRTWLLFATERKKKEARISTQSFPLESPSEKKWLLRPWKPQTVTYKKYLYRFRINQITFTYGEMKNERPVSYGMFSQNLSISTPSTATLPQRSAIGVRTQPVLPLGTRVTWQCARFQPIKRCVIFFMLIITVEITWLPRQSTSRWSISLYDQALRRRHGNRKSEEVDDEVDVSCGSKSFCNVYGRATWLIPWLERSSAKLQGKTEIHIDRNLVSKIAETDYHWVSDILFRIKRVPQVR